MANQQEYGILLDETLITLINFVLLYYLYQMRVVQIKLESDDHVSYKKKFIKAKIKWILISILSLIAMGLEIAWDILAIKKDKDNHLIVFYISASCLFLQLIVYAVLIYDQWSVFLYYIKNKKERAQL
jgi:hypothetical protein